MESHIPPHIDKLYAEKHIRHSHSSPRSEPGSEPIYSCDMTSSSVQLVNAPIPTDLFLELKAMASDINLDANCLAGELLSIAIQEALDSLAEEDRHHLKSIKVASQQAAANKRMEDQVYDAGAT